MNWIQIAMCKSLSGLRPTDFFGALYMQNTTDIELGSIDGDKVCITNVRVVWVCNQFPCKHYMHRCVHTCTCIHICACMHISGRARTCTHIDWSTLTLGDNVFFKMTLLCTYTHTYTYVCIHPYMATLICPYILHWIIV